MTVFDQREFWTGDNTDTRYLIRCIAKGDTIRATNGSMFRGIRRIQQTELKAGMVVLAGYAHYNNGVDVCEVLGFTGWDESYGKGGVKFQSLKELMSAEDVSTPKQLEAKQDENEYGYQSYLVVRELDTDVPDEGPWYYQYEGRWVRGSGAEALSFVLLEEVVEEPQTIITQQVSEWKEHGG